MKKNHLPSFSRLSIILVAFLISAPSLFWFTKGEILAHGPFFPWPNWSSSWWIAKQYLYTWSDGALGGINTEPSGFLYAALVTILNRVDDILQFGQGGVFFFGYAATFLSMAYLLKTLKQNNFAAIIAGTIYVLNPIIFTGMPVEIINHKIIPFNIATPLLVALLIRIFNTKNWYKYLGIFAIISLFPSSIGYSSLQYFCIHLLIIGIFCAIQVIRTLRVHKNASFDILKSSLIVASFILINVYWLIPIFSNVATSFTSRAEPGVSDSGLIHYLSSTMSNSLQMLQYPGQRGISKWIDYYHQPAIVFLSFGIVIVGICSLLVKKIRNDAIYPAVLLVIGLFLSKGTLPFFEGLSNAIFLTSPYITRLFRNPTYFGLIIAFSTSILFGLSLGYMYDRLKGTKTRGLMSILVVSTTIFSVIYGWQYIIGSPTRNSTLVQKTEVPQSFINATKYIKADDTDFRVISIPLSVNSTGNNVSYNWLGKYTGVCPVGVWSSKSTYIPMNQSIDDYSKAIFAPTKESISSKDWINELHNKNVKYVTLHQDVDVPDCKNTSECNQKRDNINDFIRSNLSLERVFADGPVEVFRLQQKFFSPHIFTNDKTIISNYKKINPTKYTITIENATKPYTLVFLESFNPGWKVNINKSKVTLDEKKHVQFDSYANSWSILPDDAKNASSYDLTIEYYPQRVANVGYFISGFSVLLFTILWLFSVVSRKSPKK